MKSKFNIVFCTTLFNVIPAFAGDPVDEGYTEFSCNAASSVLTSSSSSNTWNILANLSERSSNAMAPKIIATVLTVKWQPVVVDEIGEVATIRGQLMKSQTTADEPTAIGWRQGVTVALRKQPVSNLNVTEPISLLSDQSVTKTCVTNESGSFEVSFNLVELIRDKAIEQKFRCGLALAEHRNNDVFWSSTQKPLELSYADLTFPPNPAFDPAIAAMRVACEKVFNPHSIIMAVNTLHPLGKEAAISRIEAFLKSRELVRNYLLDDLSLFWILRLLFEPIELDIRVPPPIEFIDTVSSSVEPNWPLNPLVVVDNIPFRYVGGLMGGSLMTESPRSHIQFVRAFCVIRDAPLHPTQDPVLTAQRLIESPLVTQMPKDDRKFAIRSIRSQAMMLLPISRRNELQTPDDDEAWSAIIKRSQESPAVWNQLTGFQKALE